jgi:hypothetical protein
MEGLPTSPSAGFELTDAPRGSAPPPAWTSAWRRGRLPALHVALMRKLVADG